MKRYSRSLATLALNRSISLPMVAIATVGVGVSLLAGGCGSGGRTISAGSSSSVGGGGTSFGETGNATLQIQWPTRKTNSRLIPVASNTILVQISFRGKVVATQTITRPSGTNPTSTVSFPSLPVGQLGVVVYAIPDATVSSPTTAPTDAQATGSGTINIQANKTSTLTLTLGTTIVAIGIVPFSGGTTNLLTNSDGNTFDYLTVNQTHNFDIQAVDKNGNAVVLATGANTTVQWSSGNANVLKVSPHTADNGVDITGVASGDTTLYVRENESSLQTSIPVSVRGPLASVRITSILPALYKNGIMEFDYAGVDSAGNVIPGAALSSASWASSNPSIASIDSSSGQCTGVSPGSAAGSTSATAFITLSAGGFQDTQIVTVNAGTIAQQFSPNTVILAANTSQRFQSWTANPFRVPSGVTYSIVVPDGGSGSFGTLEQHGDKGYCIYTTPATKPTVTSNGTTVTVTTITLHASNGAPDAVVTLQ